MKVSDVLLVEGDIFSDKVTREQIDGLKGELVKFGDGAYEKILQMDPLGGNPTVLDCLVHWVRGGEIDLERVKVDQVRGIINIFLNNYSLEKMRYGSYRRIKLLLGIEKQRGGVGGKHENIEMVGLVKDGVVGRGRDAVRDDAIEAEKMRVLYDRRVGRRIHIRLQEAMISNKRDEDSENFMLGLLREWEKYKRKFGI